MRAKTELDVICHVSHAVLAHKKDVQSLLNDVLDVLQNDMGLERGTLTLKRDGLLIIEAARGLNKKEQKRGQYRLGEGITGRVAETGESIIIMDISNEPNFLDRTKTRKAKSEVAFLCVPIKHNEEIIGTISIDCPSTTSDNLSNTMKLLETVANIIADGVAALRAEVEEREGLVAENLRLKNELGECYKPGNIIGNCNRMRTIYGMMHQVAGSQATVLIRGESGTGKELIAKAVHYASPRKDKPFIAVNCAALPEGLIVSELFGHEKGAFTGADVKRKGRFELASGGTLFLDEIGDISVATQVKLLRVLQEKVFERVGGHLQIKTDVRIIAATSRNLEEAMKEGIFREDLYYRLNVFPLNIPPLRERKTDIMLLADYFLEKYNRTYSKSIKRISTPAINMLMTYYWPGNVRELENCIERALLVTTDDAIHAYDLSPSLQTGQASHTAIIKENGNAGLKELVEHFEREIIIESLKKNNSNIAASARQLKTTQRILHYKIEKLGMETDKFVSGQRDCKV
jgi:Nif-specific regulatory protein